MHVFEHGGDDVLAPEEVCDSRMSVVELLDVDLENSMFLKLVLVVITDGLYNFAH